MGSQSTEGGTTAKQACALDAVEQKLSRLLQRHEPAGTLPMQQAVRLDLSMHESAAEGPESGARKPPSLRDASCLVTGSLPLPDLPLLLTDLEAIVHRGERALANAYTHRSLATAMPKAGSSTNDPELLKRQFHVLHEGIASLRSAHEFGVEATSFIVRMIQRLGGDGVAASEEVLGLCTRLVQQLTALDALKAARQSMSHDLRAFVGIVKRLEDAGLPLPEGCSGADDPADIALQDFLDRPWCCLEDLAERLKGLDCAHRSLSQLIHYVYYALKETTTTETLRLPSERFTLLGSLPALLVLVAGFGGHPDNAEESCTAAQTQGLGTSSSSSSVKIPAGVEVLTRPRLLKCLRILRRHPVVPGIGDLVVQPGVILSLSPFLAAVMQEAKDVKVLAVMHMDAKAVAEAIQHHNATVQADQVTLQHFQAVTRLVTLQARVSEIPADTEPAANVCAEALAATRAALAAMSRWTCLLVRIHAWKIARAFSRGRPMPEDCNANAPASVMREYEEHELVAITETIACLKGLCTHVLGCIPWLQPLVNRAAHRQAQEFACSTIQHMIKPSSKSAVKDMLIQLQTVLAYWPGGAAPEDQGTKGKRFIRAFGKKIESATTAAAQLRKAAAIGSSLPSTASYDARGSEWDGLCPPSRLQSAVVRHLLEQLLAAGETAGKRSFLNSADLSSTSLRELSELMDAAKHWGVLSDLHSAAMQASDLSDLWLQEQELEMRFAAAEVPTRQRGLTSALLAAALKRPGAGTAVLAPLHVLNDACQRALHDLKVAHLYEEIRFEAANLMEIFQKVIAEHLFADTKAAAAAQLCDGALVAAKGGTHKLSEGNSFPCRLEELFDHRRFTVVGHALDIQSILTARLVKLFRANAEHLILRFESSPISSVVELESQVAVLRRAHELLGEVAPLGDWSDLWSQADKLPQAVSEKKGCKAVTAGTFDSRIARRASDVICTEVLPGYVMCSGRHRLFEQPHAHNSDNCVLPEAASPCFLISRAGPASSQAHMQAVTAHSGWFGEPHLSALLGLIGHEGVAWLVDVLREHAENLISTSLSMNLKDARDAMSSPQTSAVLLQGATSGQAASAIHSFYRSQLECLQACQAGLVGALAELGNCTFLVALADSVLQLSGRLGFLQGAPFFGIAPAASSGLCRPVPLPAAGSSRASVSALERLLRITLEPAEAELQNACQKNSSTQRLNDTYGGVDIIMQQVGAQFWDASIPYGHLQQWLLSLEATARGAMTTSHVSENCPPPVKCGGEEACPDPSAHQGGTSTAPGVELCHVIGGVLFVLADEQAGAGCKEDGQAANTASGNGRPGSQVLPFGDGVQFGAALLLCLANQELKWRIMDFSRVVMNAAALEGHVPSLQQQVNSTRRLSGDVSSVVSPSPQTGPPRGSRQQPKTLHPLASFLQNAAHLRVIMSTAMKTIATALPNPSPPVAVIPGCSHLKNQASMEQVMVEREMGLPLPDLVERIPEGLILRVDERHQRTESRIEPRSPGGSSFASVTTKVNSPSASFHQVDVNVTRAFSKTDSIPEDGAEAKNEAQFRNGGGVSAVGELPDLSESSLMGDHLRKRRLPPPPQNLLHLDK